MVVTITEGAALLMRFDSLHTNKVKAIADARARYASFDRPLGTYTAYTDRAWALKVADEARMSKFFGGK